MQKIEQNKFYSPREVVDFGIASKSTLAIWRMNKTGIPYSKIGGAVKYLGADILEFMEANKVYPESEVSVEK